jgi:hypothetical protein
VYIWFDLKCICVWCLDNWYRISSGKLFSTFSRARLKTLQFRLTLTPLFTATHAFFFLSLSPFFSWSVIGVVRVSSVVVFFLFSWPSIYVSYWFTVICQLTKFSETGWPRSACNFMFPLQSRRNAIHMHTLENDVIHVHCKRSFLLAMVARDLIL